jgi:hypothetical protein
VQAKTEKASWCGVAGMGDVLDIDVRKAMPSTKLPREEFEKRMRARLADPTFDGHEREIATLINACWRFLIGQDIGHSIGAKDNCRRLISFFRRSA